VGQSATARTDPRNAKARWLSHLFFSNFIESFTINTQARGRTRF
jgi:hypothetical protein